MLRSLMIACLFLSHTAYAEMTQDVIAVQTEWAEINYQVESDKKDERYQSLLANCEQMTAVDQVNTESLIWCGIVNSTYAGVAGGLSALKYAKIARKEFEQALEQDGAALSGSAYTSLGVLYYKVPGWPIGFGSDKKAEELLKIGLEHNPDGIDSNYFYAEFLVDQGEEEAAREYLARAKNAAPRPGRELADEGRHGEISALLQQIAAD
ncbi:MAG: hypothetical protein DRR04_11720 [Gammaproteobacteria bacterium]|nr:MAG: hypothetical protein DRR04_11720 [Gammaproteobacteria bacterium]